VNKVNIREKLSLFHEHWSPRVVGELNGQHVKLVKFQPPLEVLNKRFGDVGLHDQPLLSGRGSDWTRSVCDEHTHRLRASHKEDHDRKRHAI
jgi:hypothetical protein